MTDNAKPLKCNICGVKHSDNNRLSEVVYTYENHEDTKELMCDKCWLASVTGELPSSKERR